MKKSRRIVILMITICMILCGCVPNTKKEQQSQQKEMIEAGFVNEEGACIKERFLTPEGYSRTTYLEDSFAYFMENYPLYEYGKEVMLHNGNEKRNQDAHISVFQMDVTSGDLQQCADSVIRMYAEYLYQQNLYDKMQFHFVSGFNCEFSKWVNGNRVKVEGNSCTWYSAGGYDASNESFEKYLRTVFSYASTLSLEAESKPIPIEEIQIGDIFIKGGSPGHVVMVVDVCENEQGEKAFLLAQGYMPAQEFHILKNPLHENNPWYYESEFAYPLKTPEYDFSEGSLMRPNYLE